MARITQETQIELARRESLALGDLHGHVVECRSGVVWLTVDGERRDVILGPGQAWTIASRAAVVVSAFKAATLSLHCAPNRASRLAWMRGALDSLLHCRFPPLIFADPTIR